MEHLANQAMKKHGLLFNSWKKKLALIHPDHHFIMNYSRAFLIEVLHQMILNAKKYSTQLICPQPSVKLLDAYWFSHLSFTEERDLLAWRLCGINYIRTSSYGPFYQHCKFVMVNKTVERVNSTNAIACAEDNCLVERLNTKYCLWWGSKSYW
jgi:hypothetical protein